MPTLEELLQESAAFHRHLCPRQVLGVRMGLLAGRRLGLDVPRDDKRLLTFVETDGCAADGVSVATGCRVGGRTLRVIDFGKVAATFVDTSTGGAIRVAPAPDVRRLSIRLPAARSALPPRQMCGRVPGITPLAQRTSGRRICGATNGCRTPNCWWCRPLY